MQSTQKISRSFFLAQIIPLIFLASGLSGCGGGGGTDIAVTPPIAGSAIVSWSPVTQNIDNTPCTDLAGYRVYYADTPGVDINSTKLDVGNVTSIEIGQLTSGRTYYFRVSSYDQSGNESPISSEEVSKPIL